MNKDALTRIKECRGRAIWNDPFWGTLLLKLDIKEFGEKEEYLCKKMGLEPTMATDGSYIMYSPTFVDTLNNDELLFVLVHEVLHCMLFHHTRRMERQPLLWNIATDQAVNTMLVNNNVGKIPTSKSKGKDICVVIEPEGKYANKTSEEIYDDLWKKQKKVFIDLGISDQGQPQDGQGDSGNKKVSMPGGVFDKVGKGTNEQEETKWKQHIADAVSVAKYAGKLPADLERWVDGWITPKVDWKQILADWISERTKSEYSWMKRNKRFPNIYLPGIDGWSIGNVVIAIDTSGSIDEIMLRKFLGALEDLRSSCKCSVDIISVDTQADAHKHYNEEQSIRGYTPIGGGGTDFSPAFEWVEQKLSSYPCGLIYFTDTYGSYPSKKPPYKTLWITWTKEPEKPTFGDLLIMDN